MGINIRGRSVVVPNTALISPEYTLRCIVLYDVYGKIPMLRSSRIVTNSLFFCIFSRRLNERTFMWHEIVVPIVCYCTTIL